MRTQVFMGMFALLTFMLACAAIGRGFGLRTVEVLYLSAFTLMLALTYLWRRKRG